mmetsp:Transcript_57645/g.117914  ORF Transcript_57645/g.117914 Transcript_57645/m.117914 type:complete len:201 (-) Transcript_57645:286-888(-)
MLPSSWLSPASIVPRMSAFSDSSFPVISLSRPPTSDWILERMSDFTFSRSLATFSLASVSAFSAETIWSSTDLNFVAVLCSSSSCFFVRSSMALSCSSCFAFCSASIRSSIAFTSVTLAVAADFSSWILPLTSATPSSISTRMTFFSFSASSSSVLICSFILVFSSFCSLTCFSIADTSLSVCQTLSRTTPGVHSLCDCP